MLEFVVNSYVMSCCGRPRSECDCPKAGKAKRPRLVYPPNVLRGHGNLVANQQVDPDPDGPLLPPPTLVANATQVDDRPTYPTL